jgi:hypothetical protein
VLPVLRALKPVLQSLAGIIVSAHVLLNVHVRHSDWFAAQEVIMMMVMELLMMMELSQ